MSLAVEMVGINREKCDLRQPTCSQCTRACVSCPGYKDSFSLRIRDETFTTRCKAQEIKRRRNQPLLKTKSQPHGTTKTLALEHSITRTTESINALATGHTVAYAPPYPTDPSWLSLHHGTAYYMPKVQHDRVLIGNKLSYPTSLTIDLEEAALNNFLNNYASHSVFDYLPDFYNSLRGSNPAIDLAVSVPALALLSQDIHHPALLRLSYSKYAKVLQVTQNALGDTNLSTCDGTLLSVLLLALFEALVLKGREQPTNWNAHIQGSAALLEMRGTKQFDRPIGWHLFFHASNSIRTNCVIKAMPVPKSLGFPLWQNSPFESQNRLALRIGRVLDEFAQLRAYKTTMKYSKWILKSCALDNEIEEILSEMSKNMPFKIANSVKASGLPRQLYTFTDGADEYLTTKALKRWNTLRMIRIFLDDLICGALSTNYWDKTSTSPVFYQISDEKRLCLYQLTKNRAELAITAILRSVPKSISSSDMPQFSGKSLICPLSAIAVSRLASESAKESARNILRFLGHTYGLIQATESANMAMEYNDVGDW